MNNKEYLEEAKEDYPGWWEIIERLDKQLQMVFPDGYTIEQIKEKFGVLRYYWTAPQGASVDNIKLARGCVSTAESDSKRVCMVCGSAGKHHTEVSWHCTLCDDCFNEEYPEEKK